MCEFVSFIVTTDGRILAGTLTSHSGVAAAYGVAPGRYREAEWTCDDDGASLVVRSEPGETNDDRIEWREKVLRRHPNRASLLSGITEGRQADQGGVTVIRYRNGKLHCTDGPAIVRADGTRVWYLDDKLHRVDGPAVERANGTRVWYLDDKLHRVDGPAVEYADGSRVWYLDDKLHRVDGPAVECADGSRAWWLEGKRHRVDGPAVERADGWCEWWLDGDYIRRAYVGVGGGEPC